VEQQVLDLDLEPEPCALRALEPRTRARLVALMATAILAVLRHTEEEARDED
jgi:hypothetical protein